MAFITDVSAEAWFKRYLLVGGDAPTVQLPLDEQVAIMITMRDRIAKVSPMIRALAVAATAGDCRAAFDALPTICRTATMLFEFLTLYKGPWGRRLRRALRTWYNDKDAMQLAYQITKYRNRHGWSHRDVLRTAHIAPSSDAHQICFAYAIEAPFRLLTELDEPQTYRVQAYLKACKTALECTNAATLVDLIREFKMGREHCPPDLMVAPVWAALLDNMPITALLRNLAAMTAADVFKDAPNITRVTDRLLGAVALHPLNILLAVSVYNAGAGVKGSLRWTPVPAISAALDTCFYNAITAMQPTNKRILVCLDISGSMVAKIAGTHLSAREASTAIAMALVRSEPECMLMAFTDTLVPVTIEPHQSIDSVMATTSRLHFGNTNCSLPMEWAQTHRIKVDAFVVLTDSETNTGKQSPRSALRAYRNTMEIANAKLVVMGLTASSFTIADPTDPGMLDIAGFDTDTADTVAAFIRDY